MYLLFALQDRYLVVSILVLAGFEKLVSSFLLENFKYIYVLVSDQISACFADKIFLRLICFDVVQGCLFVYHFLPD